MTVGSYARPPRFSKLVAAHLLRNPLPMHTPSSPPADNSASLPHPHTSLLVGLHMWGTTCVSVGIPICGVVGLWLSPCPHLWGCVYPHLWASPFVYLWASPFPHVPICGDGDFHAVFSPCISALFHFQHVGIPMSPSVGFPICGVVGLPMSPPVHLCMSPFVILGSSPYPHPHKPPSPHL